MTKRCNYIVSSSQAKRLSMNDLAAIKVIKLEPGERSARRMFGVVESCCPYRHLDSDARPFLTPSWDVTTSRGVVIAT